MNDHPAIIFAAAMIFTYGLFSKIADRSPVTAPMVFVAMGILVGPIGFNFFDLEVRGELIHILTEVTLVLILFVDASTINLKQLIQDRNVPIRLLLIGLPLTMVLGTAVAYLLFPDVSIWQLILMALILSPTDAALGQAVVKSEKVPARVRRWISVESGLNDGIALPFIFACIALLSVSVDGSDKHWVLFLLQQIVLGIAIGGLVGWLGGSLVSSFSNRDWMNNTFQRLVSGSLAILCFSLAEMFHGNGFIAAFAGGLLLGSSTSSEQIRERIQEFGEAEGQQLILFVFLIFAMAMVPQAVGYWDFNAWLYAVLSLTIIRMLPVAISLYGKNLGTDTLLFVGWFGPRGIASVLYLLLVVNMLGVEGYERVLAVIVLTVLLSVFAHGVSALPLSDRYGKSIEKVN
ncbi:MAG: sodium:proton antiporter [Gammaproteobacteria bacterium]|nr:MAG: sodium:proton antiporter [Gammaproteobacteria bacterium]